MNIKFFQIEKQLKFVNVLYKYKFKRTTDDLQINLVVRESDKIQVVLYFSFDSLNLRNERAIIENLLEKIPIQNQWYLVPSYFVTKVELSNCKYKNFTVFTILKKWIGRISFHLRNFEKDMKKNALNTL